MPRPMLYFRAMRTSPGHAGARDISDCPETGANRRFVLNAPLSFLPRPLTIRCRPWVIQCYCYPTHSDHFGDRLGWQGAERINRHSRMAGNYPHSPRFATLFPYGSQLPRPALSAITATPQRGRGPTISTTRWKRPGPAGPGSTMPHIARPCPPVVVADIRRNWTGRPSRAPRGLYAARAAGTDPVPERSPLRFAADSDREVI